MDDSRTQRPRTGMACLALGLTGAVLAVVGCQDRSAAPPPTAPLEPTTVAAPAADAAPAGTEGGASPATTPAARPGAVATLMTDWPTGPDSGFAGALVLSGQMIGYQEPCGCSSNQRGGLVRRMVVVESLRKRGWDLSLLDLGSLATDNDAATRSKDRGGPEQRKIKFQYSLKALGLLDYDAMALSVDDLRLGTAEVLMQYLNSLSPKPDGMKILAGNVKPTPGMDFEKVIVPSVRTAVGPVTVGITAVVEPKEFEALNDAEKSALLSVQSAEEALPAILADLQKDTKLQVLLVQGSPEFAKGLAQAHPEFEVIVATYPFADMPAKPETLNDGRTQLVSVGKKSMYIGVLGLYVGADGAPSTRFQRVELGEVLDADVALAAPMKALIGDELQGTLKAAGVLQSYPKRPYALFDAPADATFAGAESCRDCHAGSYKQWAATRHAHGYEVLIADPHDPKRNREFDAACVSCHTVGLEYVSGYVDTQQTPDLLGIQCESCHGPASKHVEDPKNETFLKAVRRTKQFFETSPEYGCVRCHDEDNDPHFDFAEYWPKVEHNGLDDVIRERAARPAAPVPAPAPAGAAKSGN